MGSEEAKGSKDQESGYTGMKDQESGYIVMNEEKTSNNPIIKYSMKAHDQACNSGFWEDYDCLMDLVEDAGYSTSELTDMAVVQKIALVFTEVREFFVETGTFKDNPKIVEELADIVIRMFDVLGFYLQQPDNAAVFGVVEGEKGMLSQRLHLYSGKTTAAFGMYSSLSEAIQLHRKSDHRGFFLNLCATIFIAQDYVSSIAEDVHALKKAIEAKMEVNKTRKYKHGTRY